MNAHRETHRALSAPHRGRRLAWLAGLLLVSTRAAGAAEGQGSDAAPPADWLSAVTAEIARSEYRFSPTDDGAWSAPNRAQGLRTRIDAARVEVVSRTEGEAGFKLVLALEAWGRGDDLEQVEPGTVIANDDGASLDRGGIVEWYVNDERGLEQGFTLDAPPVGDRSLPLVLEIELGGTLGAYPAEDGQSILFKTARAEPALRYAGLRVTDGDDRVLVARLRVLPQRLLIEIEDDGASYPIEIDPVMTSPAWTAESGQGAAYFGASAATAGDVNGDGYSDVIVGAPNYDNGDDNEGRAHLYLGSASGLAASAAWTAESDQSDALFGASVATAGDVNGDGFSDVIVGAPAYDNNIQVEGRAFVYLGSGSGLAASAAWMVDPADRPFADFGQSVATAGDVNGDGFSDVIIGCPDFSNGQNIEGAAFAYLGSASGLAADAAWTVESHQLSASLGRSVATAGDVNGDGYSDVVIGVPDYNNGQVDEGGAFLYLGSASGPAGAPAQIVESNQGGARLGWSVSTAGDVNGDGYADVIVGAREFTNGQTDEGGAFLYLGSAGGLVTTPAWTAEGNNNAALLGSSVATVGDVNGDGYADVGVGAPRYTNGQAQEGRASVYLGSASGLSASPVWTVESDQSTADFGIAIATAGDVDGDGYSDVIVGAALFTNGQSQEGRTFVYHGSAAGLAATSGWTGESDQATAAFGWKVATAGDVNGDGYGDVIVGAYLYDNGENNEGRAFAYHGSASGLGPSPAWTAEGDQAAAAFGRAVATAGDVDGDGYSDVIVGAPSFTNGQGLEGRAFVYLGSSAGLATLASWTAEGNQAGAQFAQAVATAGDVNGDGRSDVIVGAYLYDNGEINEGRAFAYHGSPSGLAATPAWTVESNQIGADLGHSVSTAGDVNRDGYSDVIVSALGYDNGESEEGASFVYHGSAAGLASSPAWFVEGDQDGAQFGSPGATAGDVNGDGYSDVVVGAFFYDNGQDDEGRAYVYHGSAAGLAPSAAWSAEANQADALFGSAVATAGDVNGDGYSDVIVGAYGYDNGQTSEGRVFVYHGSASGLATTAGWTVESNQLFANFGVSVAPAGDVNGDGYADVVVGAFTYDNGQEDEGAAFVYYGNGGPGLSRRPQQFRIDNSGPIALLGASDAENDVRLLAVGRTPAGRGKVRLEGEVKLLGTPFNGTMLAQGGFTDTAAPVVGGSFVGLNTTASGLSEGAVYRWRMRIASRDPFFPRTPWFTLAYNNVTEADLRTSTLQTLVTLRLVDQNDELIPASQFEVVGVVGSVAQNGTVVLPEGEYTIRLSLGSMEAPNRRSSTATRQSSFLALRRR